MDPAEQGERWRVKREPTSGSSQSSSLAHSPESNMAVPLVRRSPSKYRTILPSPLPNFIYSRLRQPLSSSSHTTATSSSELSSIQSIDDAASPRENTADANGDAVIVGNRSRDSGSRMQIFIPIRMEAALDVSGEPATMAENMDNVDSPVVKVDEQPASEPESSSTNAPPQSPTPTRISLRPRLSGRASYRKHTPGGDNAPDRQRSKSLTHVAEFDSPELEEKPAKKKKHSAADQDSRFQTFEVEKILRKKGVKGRARYLVKWLGFDDLTWEPEKHFPKTNEALRVFKQQLLTKAKAKKLNLWDKGAESTKPDTEASSSQPESDPVVQDEVIAEHHGIPPALGEYHSSLSFSKKNNASSSHSDDGVQFIVPCNKATSRKNLSAVLKRGRAARRSPEILLKPRVGASKLLPKLRGTVVVNHNSDSRPGWAKRTGVPAVQNKERPGKVASVSVQLHPPPEVPADTAAGDLINDQESIVPVTFEMDHTYCSAPPTVPTLSSAEAGVNESHTSPEKQDGMDAKPPSPELPEVPPVYHGRIRLLFDKPISEEANTQDTQQTDSISQAKASVLPVICDKRKQLPPSPPSTSSDEPVIVAIRPPPRDAGPSIASIMDCEEEAEAQDKNLPHGKALEREIQKQISSVAGTRPIPRAPRPPPPVRERGRQPAAAVATTSFATCLAKSKRGPSSPESASTAARLTRDASTNTRTEWVHARELVRVAESGRSGLQTDSLVVNISGFKPRELAITCLDDICFLVTYADREPEFVEYQECIRKIPHMVAEFLFQNKVHVSQPVRWTRR
ncbi:uncharacterized protein LOC129581182 isoform X2 [Paramacrobiotus metropolitanus]|uniref:uncharacterized protein LOC129581182 isoform X2 n=1 Tax=Paramacrobiotus metropolitanus TaxID=2943436 RepID=UPI002446145B|nr:uncharacterized protein LOC129581182 isoform X2 [Paramacrobiotus metropolitanus]